MQKESLFKDKVIGHLINLGGIFHPCKKGNYNIRQDSSIYKDFLYDLATQNHVFLWQEILEWGNVSI